MVAETPTPTSARSSALPIIAGLAAAAIFVVDTATPLTDGVASLYVVVVLLSFSFLSTRGVMFVSLGCSVLAIASYLLLHGVTPEWDALVRLLISVWAIAAVTFLAARNRRATAVAEDRARLLDLTHDTIFVRDMKDRITYWNNGAETSYGWSKEGALGASSHQLMQTVFPQPLEAINAELLRTGRWEGELVHTTHHGQRLVVASRWSLQRDAHGDPTAILETNNDVTERKQAEEALRLSEAYLSEAQRLSQVGSFGWHITSGKLNWSEETFRIYELDPAVSPTLEFVLGRTHPEDRAAVRQHIERVTRDRLDYQYEYRLLMPNGKTKHVQVVAHANRNSSGAVEMVGAVMDVTASRQAESLITQTIDAVPASIWRARSDGSIDFHNVRALQYFGLTLEEVQDSGWGGQIHPDDRPRAYANWLASLAERKPVENLLRLRRFDGEYRWFLSRALPMLDHAGNVLAWYGSDTDIHDRTLAEEALLKAQSDLAHVTRITTLGELSASIAHEVNQPLAAIVTNGEVSLRLLEGETPDLAEVREAIGATIGDGRRASEIISRLRALSRRSEAEKAALSINNVIEEVIPLVQGQVSGHRAALHLQLSPTPAVLGDRVQLQQVIINLIINGIQAMDAVTDRARELTIRSQLDAGSVLVGVKDSGTGIDPKDADHLFNAFFTTKPGGMGMGLSICRSIIEAHGGRVWAASDAGQGASFQFVLPADSSMIPKS
jgi:PAS domain S-box-containing protein